MFNRYYSQWIAGAIGLHFVILALFAFEVIPQQYNRDDVFFWFHQGGDNQDYYLQARALMTGEFSPNKYPLGFPLLIIPILWLTQAQTHDQALVPVSLFWSAFMFPLAQIIFAWVTRRMTGSSSIAVASVWLWTALPLIVWGGLCALWNPVVAEVSAVHLLWAQMYSDGAAALFNLLLVALWLTARAKGWSPVLAVMFGVLIGFLTMIRYTGALIAISIGLALLAEGRWRVLFPVALGGIIGIAPQLAYNLRFFGSPLMTGYTVLDQMPPHGLFDLRYMTEALAVIWARWGGLAAAGGVGLLGLGCIGMHALASRDRAAALLIGSWIVGYIGLYVLYYYSWTGSLLRFLIPALPAFVLTFVLATDTLWKIFVQRRGHNANSDRRGDHG